MHHAAAEHGQSQRLHYVFRACAAAAELLRQRKAVVAAVGGGEHTDEGARQTR